MGHAKRQLAQVEFAPGLAEIGQASIDITQMLIKSEPKLSETSMAPVELATHLADLGGHGKMESGRMQTKVGRVFAECGPSSTDVRAATSTRVEHRP